VVHKGMGVPKRSISPMSWSGAGSSRVSLLFPLEDIALNPSRPEISTAGDVAAGAGMS
jgi:hypothetical protein